MKEFLAAWVADIVSFFLNLLCAMFSQKHLYCEKNYAPWSQLYVCIPKTFSFTCVPLVHCMVVSMLYWCRNGGWGLEACVKNHCGLRLHSFFCGSTAAICSWFWLCLVLLAPALRVTMTEATSRNCCGWKVTLEKEKNKKWFVGDIWVVFVSSLIWFSVIIPRLFQDNTTARRVAVSTSAAAKGMLVKPWPEMERGLVARMG